MGTLSLYLDTSVIVPLFLADRFASRALVLIGSQPTEAFVSDFASAEFASTLGNRIRMKLLSVDQARVALANFDTWIAANVLRIEIMPSDIRLAETFLRRLDLRLRTPDALHIAVAQRLNSDLATFDTRMAESAAALGMKVLPR